MNTTSPPNVVDPNTHVPVPPPGLTKPSYSTQYTSPVVFQELSRYFGDLFPEIKSDGSEFYYTLKAPGRNDAAVSAKPVQSIDEIPESEIFKMLEGWIRMRQDLRVGDVHDRAHPLLLNLRIPNPVTCPEAYRLYRQNDESKLLIYWGFERKGSSSVPLEQAMSSILKVPIARLRSILSTSMVSIKPAKMADIEKNPSADSPGPEPTLPRKPWFAKVTFNQIIVASAAAILLFGIIATVLWATQTPSKTNNERYIIKDVSGKTYPMPGQPIQLDEPPSNTISNDSFANVNRWQ